MSEAIAIMAEEGVEANRQTIHNWREDKKIVAVRPYDGGNWKYHADSVRQWAKRVRWERGAK